MCLVQVDGGADGATQLYSEVGMDVGLLWFLSQVRIRGKLDELTLYGVRQFYIDIEKDDWKLVTLCDL